MEISKYEATYYCVEKASNTTARFIDEVAEYVSSRANEYVTIKEICKEIYKDLFVKDSYMYLSQINTISNVMKHLVDGGFVKRVKIPDGAPIELEEEKMIKVDAFNRPLMITVKADDGRKFEIEDPDIPQNDDWHWEYITIKKTVQPKKSAYMWIN